MYTIYASAFSSVLYAVSIIGMYLHRKRLFFTDFLSLTSFDWQYIFGHLKILLIILLLLFIISSTHE